MKKKLSGFTFVELMLSVAIFAVVGVAITSTLRSGFNVWKRARNLNLEERQRIFKIEKIKKELRQTFVFKKEIPFYVNETLLSFVVLNNDTINKVTYFFNSKEKKLLRAINSLVDVIKAKKDNQEVTLNYNVFMSKIDDLKFECYYQDLKSGNYTWVSKWENKEVLPSAVRMNITYTKEQTDAQTVIFPVK